MSFSFKIHPPSLMDSEIYNLAFNSSRLCRVNIERLVLAHSPMYILYLVSLLVFTTEIGSNQLNEKIQHLILTTFMLDSSGTGQLVCCECNPSLCVSLCEFVSPSVWFPRHGESFACCGYLTWNSKLKARHKNVIYALVKFPPLWSCQVNNNRSERNLWL